MYNSLKFESLHFFLTHLFLYPQDAHLPRFGWQLSSTTVISVTEAGDGFAFWYCSQNKFARSLSLQTSALWKTISGNQAEIFALLPICKDLVFHEMVLQCLDCYKHRVWPLLAHFTLSSSLFLSSAMPSSSVWSLLWEHFVN